MKQMKMDWLPYIPFENRDRQVDRINFQIFIKGSKLTCVLEHGPRHKVSTSSGILTLPFLYIICRSSQDI
ncbi:Protein HEAT INTOLERANT 4 [Cardamine amara subsp. amara]|uniref:Protein HEAT INTOLERANT 4 n=1 Tax=Cardamine amara subsp. amara TaxID=228776 RepID=A0ABD1BBL7_CARAN